MQVLDTNVLQKITRVTIKRAGFDYPKSTKMLTEAWNGKMFKPYKNRIEFDKSGKLILHNHDSNIVIKPSPDFCRAFEMSKVIPGRAEEWALLPFKKTTKRITMTFGTLTYTVATLTIRSKTNIILSPMSLRRECSITSVTLFL